MLTLDAYQRLKAELERLTTEGRADITDKIRVAREHGDLKENAEYHAAKDQQGMMESRIRKIQHMLRDPDIVEAPVHAGAVVSGMLVTVKPLDFADEDDETYLIAEHAEEKAPKARTVTTTSPFGAALMGSAEGDEVGYEAPGGTFRYRIVSIEPFTG